MEHREPEGLIEEAAPPTRPGAMIKKLEEWKGFSLVLAAVGQEKRLEIRDDAYGGLLAWTPLQGDVTENLLEVPMGEATVYRVSVRACNLATGRSAGIASQNNKRVQTQDDAEADDEKTMDSKATATSKTTPDATASQPSSKAKTCYDEDEDTSRTPWTCSLTMAVQGVKLTSKLITALLDFASDQFLDLLPINEMILATHLWMDIQASSNLAMDTSAEPGQDHSPVPNISLARMILHFGHWLKRTHLMQLDEYPHPVQWMQNACRGDLDEEDELNTAKINNLDEERIKALIDRVGTTVPGVDTSFRVRLSPCCMPGASGSHVHTSVGFVPPSRIALALTGLPDIHFMGSQSYERPTPWIAGYQLKTVSWPRSLDNLLDSLPRYKFPETQAQRTMRPKSMAPTWSSVTGVRGCWGFAPMSLPMAPAVPGPCAVRETTPTSRPPRIQTKAGMPPLTAADLYMPMPNPLLIPALMDYKGGPTGEVKEVISPEFPNEQGWKSPTGKVGSEAYDELLALWTAIPQGHHPLWYAGLKKLKAARRKDATMEDPLLFVEHVIERAQQDKDVILGTMGPALEGHFPSGKDLFYELLSAFGRCLGIDAGKVPKDTPDIWTDIYLPLANEELVPVALLIQLLLEHFQACQGMDLATCPAAKKEIAMLEVQFLWGSIVRGMIKAGAWEHGWLGEWQEMADRYGR
ncbi:hypothetical protein TgHK011_002867 [Trichoderma gracile]|nr:hypothetical protein TgHK011_002867 [Trichoderma gracile]